MDFGSIFGLFFNDFCISFWDDLLIDFWYFSKWRFFVFQYVDFKVLQIHPTLQNLKFHQRSNQKSINFRIIFSSFFMTFSASFFASNFAWIFDEKRVPKWCQNRCQNHQKSILGGHGGDKCRLRILFGRVFGNAIFWWFLRCAFFRHFFIFFWFFSFWGPGR